MRIFLVVVVVVQLASKGVTKRSVVSCLDSMTVGQVESKIARSFDAWAQW